VSKDVAIIGTGGRELTAVTQMVRELDLEATFAAENGGNLDFVKDIMEGILTAESFDDIFAAQDAGGLVSGKDFAGVPFTIEKAEDIKWLRSNIDNDNALPFYAIIRVIDLQTGEERMLNCGGSTFTPTLFRLWKREYFTEPRDLVIIAHPTTGSQAYLTLKPYKRPEAKQRDKK
jgi:hypothetical protein